MIVDKLTEFADATSVAAAAGTLNVGNQIDTSVVRDVGNGQPVYLVMTVDTAIITGGVAGTIAFQLASDSTASIAVDGTQTIHFVTNTFVTDDAALNDLDVGDVIGVYALPSFQKHAYEQFLGVQAVIGTTTTTAGAINAFLSLDPHGWTAYPQGDVSDS